MSVLERAAQEFGLLYKDNEILKVLSDAHGLYGLESYYHVICARSCLVCGKIIIPERLVRVAFEKSKRILIYISKNNKFYSIDPSRVMSYCNRKVYRGRELLVFKLDEADAR